MFVISELIEAMNEVASYREELTKVMELERMTSKCKVKTLGVYRDLMGRFHFRRGNGNYIPMASFDHAREYMLEAYALLNFENEFT